MSGRKINLLGSTWTAPPWMKTNNNFTTGYLKMEFEKAWAEYHVKALDAFRKEGVNFWGLTTGNEPLTLTTFRTSIPNLAMYPEQQRDWIRDNLGPSLQRAGYANVSLIVLDDQRKYAFWWLNIVLNSVETRKYVGGIGIHWYMDAEASPLIMDQIHSKYPEQEIIYTESSINPAVNLAADERSKHNHRYRVPVDSKDVVWETIHPKLGDWRRAILYISSLMESLLHWTAGYIDWNLALDVSGGPTGMGFTCDAPVIINHQSDEFYKQPMFYAMGHFSKFLQPASLLIHVQSESFASSFTIKVSKPDFQRPFVYQDVTYIAAMNPDGTTTIILFNPKNTTIPVTIDCGERGYAHVTLDADSLTSIIF
nr:glucocerebrosidase 4 [Nilaparvata lugens]